MNLLRAVTTVSGMTLLSRITGLARESLKATVYGAGVQMDAFEAAFRIRPQAPVARALAQHWAQRGREDLAARWREQAARLDPSRE